MSSFELRTREGSRPGPLRERAAREEEEREAKALENYHGLRCGGGARLAGRGALRNRTPLRANSGAALLPGGARGRTRRRLLPSAPAGAAGHSARNAAVAADRARSSSLSRLILSASAWQSNGLRRQLQRQRRGQVMTGFGPLKTETVPYLCSSRPSTSRITSGSEGNIIVSLLGCTTHVHLALPWHLRSAELEARGLHTGATGTLRFAQSAIYRE